MSAHRILRDLFLEHSSQEMVDPGDGETIQVDRQLAYIALEAGGSAEVRTLGTPERPGVLLLLYFNDTTGGEIVLTVSSGYDVSGNTDILFDTPGQVVLLATVEEEDVVRWRMIGHVGVAAPDQGAALTAQLTTITHTAPGTQDFALQDLVQNTGFGFVTANEGNTTLQVIANLQTRLAQVEARLESAGIIAAN